MFNQERSKMKNRMLSWKTLCVAMLLLLGMAVAPLAQAEGLSDDVDALSGEVTGVDLVKKLIHMGDDVVLHVGTGSRLFDSDGKRMDLLRLSRMIGGPDEFGMLSADARPFAFYKVVDASGRITVETLQLGEQPH